MGDIQVVVDLREGGDWSLDLCFAGLRQNLGPYRVIDVPLRDKHRQWVDPRVPHDWGKERRTLGTVLDSEGEIWDDHASNGLRDVALGIKNKRFQRVFLDERAESFVKYCELGFARAGVPAVVVAGHDKFWNFSPQYVANTYGDRLEAMLLDNWIDEYDDLPFRVNRIGWSCNFDHYWTRPTEVVYKEYDVCFIGYNSHPDRARFIDHIERKWPQLKKFILLEREPNTTERFVLKRDYFDIIQRSRIALNLRGAADGGKTMRFYEIPYVGTYMLSQRIPDTAVLSDLHEGVHCDYFDDEADLDRKIERALDDVLYRELIASQGHTRALRDLTSKARWGAVLRWLERT